MPWKNSTTKGDNMQLYHTYVILSTQVCQGLQGLSSLYFLYLSRQLKGKSKIAIKKGPQISCYLRETDEKGKLIKKSSLIIIIINCSRGVFIFSLEDI